MQRRLRSPVGSDRDTLAVAGEQLTFQRTGGPPVSLCPIDVVAIWYEYNPFGWQHANSLRIVFAQQQHQPTSIDVYDEQHTYELLLGWLQRQFPAQVASRYRELWGSPGGSDPSVHLWGTDTRGT